MTDVGTNAGSEPMFSLVFLTWNPGDAIVRTLDSVTRQTFTDYEVVVVDNDSHDGTVERIRDTYPDAPIEIVENDCNRGFSRGMNRGIRETTGQYICTYNHDTVFPEEYLELLHERITADAVWTTARRNHRVSAEQACVRLLSRHGFTIPYVVDSLSGVATVNYVPGDGTIVPRRIYEDALDGTVFDPALPIRGEDLDLSMRLAALDIPIQALLDTYSIHPDKGDRYSLTIENVRTHCRTVHARVAAHHRNDASPAAVARAVGSVITHPLVLYLTPYPRSAAAFAAATSIS